MEIQKFNSKINPYRTDRNQFPSVALIRKQSGEREAIRSIVDSLVWLRGQINVNRNLTEEQIFTTAEIILNEFYWLNPADIKICLNKGISGKYGEIYERMDSTVVCRWLTEYENERVSRIQHEKPNFKIDYEKLKALARVQEMEKKRKAYASIGMWCEEFGNDFDKIYQIIEDHKTERLKILGDCRVNYLEREVLKAINEFGLETEQEVIQIISSL